MAIIETTNKRINHKSDFDFILAVKSYNASGELIDVGFPTYDFKGYLYTRGLRKYEFSNKGGELVNCFNDDNRIHIVINAHNLPVGVLKVDFYVEIPNSIYPDGSKLTVSDCPTSIELVDGCSDEITELEATLIAPYIKGEKGDKGDTLTWEAMTEAQRQEVIESAVEAIRQEQITTTSDTDDTNEYNDVF